MKENLFILAMPVWLKNKRNTKNLQVGFRCDFVADDTKNYVLKISASTYYKVYLDGDFVAYGPARAAHGYVRVDEIDLPIKNGMNKLSVEVAGYNCPSFYSMNIKSFLTAEILENGDPIKYTGRDFNAISLENLRNIYVHRYSYQRTYGEVWNFDNNTDLYNWKTSDNLNYEKTFTFDLIEKYIDRNLPYPHYDVFNSVDIDECGTIEHKPIGDLLNVRYVKNISCEFDGFLREKWTESPVEELYGDFIKCEKKDFKDDINIKNGEYVIFKLPYNNTGFIINEITALEDSRVCVFFAEHNYGNGMIFGSFLNAINIVKYNLKASEKSYKTESFEPYTCQYIGIAVIEGNINVNAPSLKEYCYPLTENAEFSCTDNDINDIYVASINTFRQNTLDVFMDCPSRERGGWLCDSYFTAMSEKFFSGESAVEKVFLDNFVMAEEFPNIPYGMLPMVYPSDYMVYKNGYIPQWAMWYVMELRQFINREKDVDIGKYKTLCYELLKWFKMYENTDGLLEKMDGWNFVEWSKANDWVQDVNYPTNMLYSKMLFVMGELFFDETLVAKSEVIKNTVIEQSFDGKFFHDNAVRNSDGELIVTDNISETCQYYAYFFDIADNDEKFDYLKNVMLNTFGPDNNDTELMKKIVPANSFIGNYLRIIILLRMKKYEKVVSDIKGYFLKMAHLTGTLWEKNNITELQRSGSLNHGFASFAGVAIAYAMAGVTDIVYSEKEISINENYISDIDYTLKINTEDGAIEIKSINGQKDISIPKNWILRRP